MRVNLNLVNFQIHGGPSFSTIRPQYLSFCGDSSLECLKVNDNQVLFANTQADSPNSECGGANWFWSLDSQISFAAFNDNCPQSRLAKESYSLSPNPVNTHLSISRNVTNIKLTKVEIFNMYGRIEEVININSNFVKLNIDVSKLNKAIYLVKLTDVKGNSEYHKIIKE